VNRLDYKIKTWFPGRLELPEPKNTPAVVSGLSEIRPLPCAGQGEPRRKFLREANRL